MSSDYWEFVDVTVHEDLGEVMEALSGIPRYFFTTKAEKCYAEEAFPAECALVFGKETRGLEEELLVANRERCLRIPMGEGRRSLNLSNCVAIAVYEALRQHGFAGLETQGRLHRLSWKDD